MRRMIVCYLLYYILTERLPTSLVQNAAARLTTGAKPREYITPILRQLHCCQCHDDELGSSLV